MQDCEVGWIALSFSAKKGGDEKGWGSLRRGKMWVVVGVAGVVEKVGGWCISMDVLDS